MISGGGTGGHIFPAIAIANALKRINPEVEILFVGAEGRMEMEKIPAAGYQIIGLPVSGFPRKLSLKFFSFFIKLLKSMIKARRIVKTFRPDIAVGVGGYASGPALRAAASKRIPYVIQEQNSYPGITNKLLAKKANKIFVAYENMERFFPQEKIIISGNPIRQDIIHNPEKTAEAFEYFNLNPQKPVILITGGSLGALTINESIAGGINKILEKDIQIIWQTGKNYIDKAKEILKDYNQENIYVNDFIFKMNLAYAMADIIIARAGASTISELCMIGKAAILVPSPNVAEDHQTKNALALSTKNAAVLVTDAEAREKLVDTATELITNESKRLELGNNITKLAKTDSANTIANYIIKITNES